MRRDLPSILLLAGLLTVTIAVIIAAWSFDGDSHVAMSGAQWDAWKALPKEERAEIAATQARIQRRSDAAGVLGAARRFGGMPEDVQRRYRAIHTALVEVLAALTPGERRTTLGLPPRGRAAALYREMERRFPNTLAQLLDNSLGRN